MFQSRLLDRFTRVHPVVPVLIYGPVVILLLVLAVGQRRLVGHSGPRS